ncbi:MAG: DUF3616 domain-containing protein [Hydrococcus sp. RU_2_2]|nr:DUF3616 domain-containing protein [Hydrococcus sp. RU_2_2]NJP20291.1 DUF3616 domain-containing protein [Hydrococcus sp. CRU_1_1]
MTKAQPIDRIFLQFNKNLDGLKNKYLRDALSAVLWMSDRSLWLASDESTTIEKLSYIDDKTFGNHEQFHLQDFLDSFQATDEKGKMIEIDLEGIDYSENYLWAIGSHSTKRKKPKNDDLDIIFEGKDLERLAQVKPDINRYILARIPMVKDEQGKYTLKKSEGELTAAYLERTQNEEGMVSNLLIDALKNDPHFGSFLSNSTNQNIALPGKDNGFDIEGLVVRGNRILIGLRGPVLRGWAAILEIEVEDSSPGLLKLKPIGENGGLYKKYFLNLKGLGIRELCKDGEYLLILAGPTMVLDGSVLLFRLKGGIERLSDRADKKVLEIISEIPIGEGCDRPEGMTIFPYSDSSNALLVVYDSPAENRFEKDDPHSVWADVFEI